MIWAPSMSASRSYSRLNRRNAVPRPNCVPCRDHLAPAAADDRAQHRAGNLSDLVLRRLARLRRAVAQQHVTELVRHHAGDLAVGVRRFDHPAVDEHRPAGQREGVDLLHVHHLERVLELRMPQFAGESSSTSRRPMSSTNDVTLSSRISGSVLRASAAACAAHLDVLGRRVAVVGRHDARLRAGQLRRRRSTTADEQTARRERNEAVGSSAVRAAIQDPETVACGRAGFSSGLARLRTGDDDG